MGMEIGRLGILGIFNVDGNGLFAS